MMEWFVVALVVSCLALGITGFCCCGDQCGCTGTIPTTLDIVVGTPASGTDGCCSAVPGTHVVTWDAVDLRWEKFVAAFCTCGGGAITLDLFVTASIAFRDGDGCVLTVLIQLLDGARVVLRSESELTSGSAFDCCSWTAASLGSISFTEDIGDDCDCGDFFATSVTDNCP